MYSTFCNTQECNIYFRIYLQSSSPLIVVMTLIWVKSRNCGCRVTWFCYHLIAKPGNKTATVPWPDPYEKSSLRGTWGNKSAKWKSVTVSVSYPIFRLLACLPAINLRAAGRCRVYVDGLVQTRCNALIVAMSNLIKQQQMFQSRMLRIIFDCLTKWMDIYT